MCLRQTFTPPIRILHWLEWGACQGHPARPEVCQWCGACYWQGDDDEPRRDSFRLGSACRQWFGLPRRHVLHSCLCPRSSPLRGQGRDVELVDKILTSSSCTLEWLALAAAAAAANLWHSLFLCLSLWLFHVFSLFIFYSEHMVILQNKVKVMKTFI